MSKRKSTTKIPVMLRVHGKRAKSPANASDLVAIFPAEAGTNDLGTMSCYCPTGEHSTCGANYAGSATRPATPDEAARLLNALERAGYNRAELHVVKRPSAHHMQQRRAQINR